jgi:hypothetical protein
MKGSFVTAALILAAIACLGWRGSSQLASARERNSRLQAEAAALGISPDPANPREKVVVNRNRESRPSLTVAEYIAFAKEMQAKQKQGSQDPGSDEEAMKRVMAMIDRLSSLDADELKRLITELRASTELEEESRGGAAMLVLMTLASRHPQAALALLTSSSEALVGLAVPRKHFIATALGSWAMDDPMGAAKWIQDHHDKYPDLITDEVKRPLIANTATQDPKLAFQLLGDLKFKDGANAIASIVNAAKAPAERTAALQALREYAGGLADPQKRDVSLGAGLTSLAEQMATEGFQQGTQWLDSAKLSPAELQGIANNLPAHSMPTSDIGQWAEWLAKNLPESEKTSGKISTMVGAWTEKDYTAAGTWLTQLAEGPTKQAAVRGYVQAVAPYEPETAAQWAMTLPSGEDRARALKQIYHQWPKNDPAAKAAAESFADQHGIKR